MWKNSEKATILVLAEEEEQPLINHFPDQFSHLSCGIKALIHKGKGKNKQKNCNRALVEAHWS